jgi:EAL domain-containing protein (putative c-di-GMP-specific phosphodiesterase class I)
MELKSGSWYLEGFVDDGTDSWRTRIAAPFRVGRASDCQLKLYSPRVSGRHAEITGQDGRLYVRDLGSTNGTVVNGVLIEGQVPLNEGDTVTFADREFRLIWVEGTLTSSDSTALTLEMKGLDESRRAMGMKEQLVAMLREGQVTTYFQPIIRLATHELVGFEVLGRGLRDDLPVEPAELLMLAEALGVEVALSDAFRRSCVPGAQLLPAGTFLYVNLHPAELERLDELVESLEGLREALPTRDLVLEVHELAITDLRSFASLRDRLKRVRIDLAFDDFGNGRSRFLELVELGPRTLKFDRSMISGIDRGSRRRRDMVGRLVQMVRALGIETLAEGIETEGEAQCCVELGFDLAQGFLYGRPNPAESFVKVS